MTSSGDAGLMHTFTISDDDDDVCMGRLVVFIFVRFILLKFSLCNLSTALTSFDNFITNCTVSVGLSF